MTIRRLAAGLAMAVLCLHPLAADGPRAGDLRTGVRDASTTSRPRPAKAGRRYQHRRSPRAPGTAEAAAEIGLEAFVVRPGPGGTVLLRVTLSGGAQAAQHASFDVGVDPSQMRFAGFLESGRGALIARESPTVPGVVGVYRSALPGGFDRIETLVEIEFEIVATGGVPLALTEVRLLDASGRDLPWTIVVGELHLE